MNTSIPLPNNGMIKRSKLYYSLNISAISAVAQYNFIRTLSVLKNRIMGLGMSYPYPTNGCKTAEVIISYSS